MASKASCSLSPTRPLPRRSSRSTSAETLSALPTLGAGSPDKAHTRTKKVYPPTIPSLLAIFLWFVTVRIAIFREEEERSNKGPRTQLHVDASTAALLALHQSEKVARERLSDKSWSILFQDCCNRSAEPRPFCEDALLDLKEGSLLFRRMTNNDTHQLPTESV